MNLYEENSNSYPMVEMKTKFTYTGIRVKDLKQSVQFYTQILGMKETGRSRIEQSKGEVVNLITHEGGPVLELNYYESGSPFDSEYVPGEAMDHLAFQVDDLDKALAEAGRAGYPQALEMKSSTSRWAYIKDPNGIFIELFS
jgi:catechol 2,3-dioxygenase-like lactoylglutathione lyase family enzyme